MNDELYRRVDALLAERAKTFPARVEPVFSDLLTALRDLGAALRAAAGPVVSAPPPAELAGAAVFVLGYYRSGTSLLLDLLRGHPDLTVLPGESRHFDGVRDRLQALPEDRREAELHDGWIRRIVSPDGLPPFWTLGRPWVDGGPDLYLRFTQSLLAYARGRQPGRDLLGIAAVALAAATGRPARRWVEKTPRHTLMVDEILAAYPEARFVHIVRDPRATLASIEAYNRSRRFVSVPVAAAELGEALRVACVNRERLADRYLVVRYEDLVAQPETEMRKVVRLLDLSWTDALVTPSFTANSSSADRRVAGAIHGLSAGRGADLRGWPLALARVHAADVAPKLGYELAPLDPVRSAGVRTAVALRFRTRSMLARARATARRRSPSS